MASGYSFPPNTLPAGETPKERKISTHGSQRLGLVLAWFHLAWPGLAWLDLSWLGLA